MSLHRKKVSKQETKTPPRQQKVCQRENTKVRTTQKQKRTSQPNGSHIFPFHKCRRFIRISPHLRKNQLQVETNKQKFQSNPQRDKKNVQTETPKRHRRKKQSIYKHMELFFAVIISILFFFSQNRIFFSTPVLSFTFCFLKPESCPQQCDLMKVYDLFDFHIESKSPDLHKKVSTVSFGRKREGKN